MGTRSKERRDVPPSETASGQFEIERRELVRAVRGRYAHVQTTSESFGQRKQEDIDLEDCRQ